MLYKISLTNGKFDHLEPEPFKNFSNFDHIEKDLENLIASSLLEVLFEDSRLMPVFQERQRQAEADIYALNEKGELIIFELKRASAGDDALHQALRYAQDAGQWSYAKLQDKYQGYLKSSSPVELTQAHKEAFNLEHALEAKEINAKQHLIVIGSAADDSLINSVTYWKKQGVSIDFLPYRIFEIANEKYFEFFALPYDKHRNPGDIKGVLFDTNRSWDDDSIWYMMNNNCVAAFGEAKRFVEYVYPGDIVFFSHKWEGIIAAGKVKKGQVVAPDDETLYRYVEFITPIPKEGSLIKAMPFKMVSAITGKSFFWARTIKVPYLSRDEAYDLAGKLKTYLEAAYKATLP